jgi:adenylylsulfate kinase-like enzyme
MIVVLFGQPHSGKTTLAKKLIVENNDYHIDGDALRDLFKNKDYSKNGRINNLNRASDIATYLDFTTDKNVVLSLVYPYKEAREYLDSISNNVKWIYLTYNLDRGREGFHVEDFDIPNNKNNLHLNTDTLSEDECINQIKLYVE